jgi:hypothetical protein
MVALDHNDNIYTNLTWDFDSNVEHNILQCKPAPNDVVGYHVVKGMNLKMNYMINQHHVMDLEYNIPLRQTYVNQGIDPQSI